MDVNLDMPDIYCSFIFNNKSKFTKEEKRLVSTKSNRVNIKRNP